jgi:hypothetical protein
VLEILWVLGRLDPAYLRDERAREALDLVVAKADAEGRWKLAQTFNDRFVVPIEAKGEPSRWVTLRALDVLRVAGQRRPTAPPRPYRNTYKASFAVR